jgi:tetratricopeptide (TPR) repeat protein
VPDAKDGVPEAIEPLTWEHEAQPSDASTASTTANASSVSENESLVQPPNQSRLSSSSAPAPKKSPDRIAEARLALEEARWQEATELYQQAIQRARGKKLDAIIQDLQAVVRAQPSSKRAWELLADAYTRKSDWPAADDAYKRALSLIEDA